MNDLTTSIIGKIVKQKHSVYGSHSDEEVGKAYIHRFNPNFQPAEISHTPQQSAQLQSMPQNVHNQALSLIQKYFPKSQWTNAYNVMMGESGGNAGAVGDNYPINGETIPSYGLFQIRGLPGRPNSHALLNPEQNVAYAAQMQAQQGWGPWTAARNLGIY